MRIRSIRPTAVAAALPLAAAIAGTLTWVPAAEALDPTPSTGTALTAETGGVHILKKDPGGDVLAGVTFALFNSAGQQAGTGTTDADGQLTFNDLAPDVYRLKELSSGSPLHDEVDDQDVIVPPGTEAPLTIIDPFKPATVTLKAKDDKSGKLLPGSTVNIGTGDTTVLTLTTASNGTASAKLPVNSRAGTSFWAKQTKAAAGYEIYKPSKAFKARPGDPVTVTVTNAKTATTPPPTERPTDKPIQEPSDKPSAGRSGKDDASAPSASDTPTADETASSTAAPAPAGSLAHTGADATLWLIGGAGVLIAVGGGALFGARRRRTDNSSDDGSNAN
ncbi:SpaA isopeptide-forming pilin-related protein [Streptomyces sp. NPDC047081]|uniref:SpaA isopeptide-forming pilin-related protein n=1 Tax=Streptomyces sp. NPDC047081 TaxID=3154706 RepID=UPI0033FE8CBB